MITIKEIGCCTWISLWASWTRWAGCSNSCTGRTLRTSRTRGPRGTGTPATRRTSFTLRTSGALWSFGADRTSGSGFALRPHGSYSIPRESGLTGLAAFADDDATRVVIDAGTDEIGLRCRR